MLGQFELSCSKEKQEFKAVLSKKRTLLSALEREATALLTKAEKGRASATSNPDAWAAALADSQVCSDIVEAGTEVVQAFQNDLKRTDLETLGKHFSTLEDNDIDVNSTYGLRLQKAKSDQAVQFSNFDDMQATMAPTNAVNLKLLRNGLVPAKLEAV